MNNKGFAVSSILYTILICFLLFLGAAMAMFSASNGLVVAANDDIINGTTLKATRIAIVDGDADPSNDICSTSEKVYYLTDPTNDDSKVYIPKWINNSDKLIKVSSRYGTKYWPRDFTLKEGKYCASSNLCVNTIDYGNINDYNSDPKKTIVVTFQDQINTAIKVEVNFTHPCR